MKKLSALVGFLSFFFVGTVAAEESELSYSNLTISYLDGDVIDTDANGFGIRGSLGFAGAWFVSAEFNRASVDDVAVLGVGEIDLDLDEIAADIGYHWNVGRRTDLVASFGVSRIELDAAGVNSVGGHGYDVNIGVRGKPVDQFEYGFLVGYYNGGDYAGDVQFFGEARYHFLDAKSVGVRYRINDDIDYWGVDIRVDF